MRIIAPGGEFTLKARFGALVQDEAAHKGALGLKGAAGLSCCAWCKNVYHWLRLVRWEVRARTCITNTYACVYIYVCICKYA